MSILEMSKDEIKFFEQKYTFLCLPWIYSMKIQKNLLEDATSNIRTMFGDFKLASK